MCKELATVRDLIDLDLDMSISFDVGNKDVLKCIQVKPYIKDEPIYKKDIHKLNNDDTWGDDYCSLSASEFCLKHGFKYEPTKNCKYTINSRGIFEEQEDFKYFQNVISFNKKTFCKYTFDDDFIFVREGKYLAYLNNVTHYMYADTKDILYTVDVSDLNVIYYYYYFHNLMQSCYKYLNSIADLTKNQILSLWHIAIEQACRNIFSEENETNSKIMQEIFDKINKDSFTQISYKEYKDNMDVHIMKSRISGAEQIFITAYNLITNSSYDNASILSLYIENQYKAPKDKPLKNFINTNDLKYYPYWKK